MKRWHFFWLLVSREAELQQTYEAKLV